MYRGEHHPTDILASVLFAALWLTAATMLIKPDKDGLDRAGRGPLGLPRRQRLAVPEKPPRRPIPSPRDRAGCTGRTDTARPDLAWHDRRASGQ